MATPDGLTGPHDAAGPNRPGRAGRPTRRRTAALHHWALVALAAVVLFGILAVLVGGGEHRRRPLVSIVALGDSVAAGTNCGCVAFPQLVGEHLENSGRMVAVYNLAGDGYTVDSVDRQLDNQSSLGEWTSGATVVTLTIGANDLASLEDKGPSCTATCYRPVADAVAVRLGALVKRLRAADRAQGSRLLWTNYWNVFQDGQQGIAAHGDAYVKWADELTVYANKVYAKQVVANGGEVVDLYQAFKGRHGRRDPSSLLASDGDHPDAEGHELIATTIENMLQME